MALCLVTGVALTEKQLFFFFFPVGLGLKVKALVLLRREL
jgi:hypothetical protein